MARARKSHATDKENAKPTHSGKLEPAQSGRVDGHRYVIYAHLTREGDPYQRNLILKFLATYAARYMVDKLIGNDSYEWKLWPDYEGAEGRDDMIVTSSGIKIRAARQQMRDILEHELTDAEKEWTDEQTLRAVQAFKYGRHEEAPKHGDADGQDDDESTANAKPEATAKPKREKVVREPKVRADTSDHVSANDIAKELRVEGREVRGVLRALKLEKPAHGNWSWPKKEASAIKDKIVAGLKDAKKGKKK